MAKKTKTKSVAFEVVPSEPSTAELTVETLNQTQKFAYDLAVRLKGGMDAMSDVYREFCMYAREKLLPKEIAQIMTLAGLHQSVASRIKAVACLPPEDFTVYQKGLIGFNAAVDKARDVKAARTGKARKVNYFSKVVAAFSKVSHKLVKFSPRLTVTKTVLLVAVSSVQCDEHFEQDGFRVRIIVEKL